MEKIVTARHFNLHDDGKENIQGRLSEIEQSYPRLTSGRVILDQQKSQFHAEVLIRGRRLDVEANGKGKDLNLAIQMAFDKADRQLHKHYDKVKDHSHQVPLSQLECEIEEELMSSEDEELSA